MSGSAPAPARADPPRARPARGLWLALAMCLLGALATLLAAGRPWLRVRTDQPLTGPEGAALRRPVAVALTGRDLAPALPALATVGLIGVVAVVATRRWGRVLAGVPVALAGAGVGASAVSVLAQPAEAAAGAGPVRRALGTGLVPRPEELATSGWLAAALVGAALLVGAGALVALRGRHWPTLSARYRVPSAAEATEPPGPDRSAQPGPVEAGDAAIWDALDRGEDPT